MQSFAAGTHKLSFTLLNSGRGTTAFVTIKLANVVTELPGIALYAVKTDSWAIATTGGAVSFANAGGDNTGSVLTTGSLRAIPLPATLPLLALGLGASGLARGPRGRRTAS